MDTNAKTATAATPYKVRTREEVLAWLNAARERKRSFEERVRSEWEEEQRHKKEVAESDYYNFDWWV